MNTLLPFHKVVGAGNDCLIAQSSDLDRLESDKARIIRSICDRHDGVGADQFFELLSTAPLAVQVWNCDGSKAEICANGTRSFLLLAREEGWVPEAAKEVRLLVSGKEYCATWNGSGYELCLGIPQATQHQQLFCDGQKIPYTSVNVGNPHAVILARGEAKDWSLPYGFQFQEWGSRIESHPDFPHKTNVEFVRSVLRQGAEAKVEIQVWERGAGATLSCGSGAVAVAAALAAEDPSLQIFAIKTNHFTLHVRLEDGKAYLSGPSRTVAKGDFSYSLSR
jgi:diaminopimelate epimerase